MGIGTRRLLPRPPHTDAWRIQKKASARTQLRGQPGHLPNALPRRSPGAGATRCPPPGGDDPELRALCHAPPASGRRGPYRKKRGYARALSHSETPLFAIPFSAVCRAGISRDMPECSRRFYKLHVIPPDHCLPGGGRNELRAKERQGAKDSKERVVGNRG